MTQTAACGRPVSAVLASRSVEWWPVHIHVSPRLQEVGCWPMAGTITWQQLEDQDPVKLASLLDAARHHILRVETARPR